MPSTPFAQKFAREKIAQPQAAKKLILASVLLGLATAGCTASNKDSATNPAASGVVAVEATEAPADASSAALLVGTWQMEMEGMMDVEQLSESERQHLSAMMEEMTFAMAFTEDGKVLSSMDDQTVDYTIQGDQVIVNGDALKFAVTDRELTLEGEGQTLTFKRTDKDIRDFASNAFASSAQQAKESEAKSYTGAMNRAQQAYYLEQSTFATALEDLGLGIKAETDLYQYSIRGAETMSFNHAVAKQSNLKSMVGAVFVVPEDESFMTTQTILCVADASGVEKLQEPSLKEGEISCSAGSSPIR